MSFPTQQVVLPPTSVAVLPPVVVASPTNTALPISVVILSPIPGNVIAGNVQILGSAIHPQFLQYQVEFGPDPNYSNLWFPATGVVQTPVLNNLLGIWNTQSLNDGLYQIRLRVFLRDGTQLVTVVNNVRVQNHAPTPVPSNTPTIPRPIAAFTQDHTTGNAPLVVKFTNQSSGDISSFSWNFGDSGSSSKKNPSHTYQSPGVYTVKLKVIGPGGTSNVSRQITVQSAAAPVAAFTQDKTSGEAPLAVKFTDQSTGNITSRAWNFGDGVTDTTQNPSHTFTNVGTYNIILTVQGSGGSSSVTRQITVENPQIPAPVAAFTPGVINGEIPLTVSFTNTSTGNISSYLWDFDGDGITDSTETNPTHIYTKDGTYTVKLTVIGPGGQDTEEATITATKPPDAPVADFSVSPASGDIPLTVNFTNASTGNITGYEWDFDGDTVVDNTDENPSHTYSQAGTYTVTLTVVGPGGSNSKSETVSATEPIAPPVADFTADVTSGEAPLTVMFTDLSSGDSLSYSWDFNGDSNVDSTDSAPPPYTYNTAGNYTVTLAISNSVGSDSKQTTINVSQAVVIAPPIAGFVANPSSGDAPLMVSFTDQSTGDITSYSWDFDNDGVVDSTNANPAAVTYSNPGVYTVSLVVSGPGGDSNPATGTITVNNPAIAPTANFTADKLSGNAPLTVNFNNTSSGDINTFSWDFDGDNIVDSTDISPTSFTYNTPGSYNATISVSGPGGQDSLSQLITVSAAPVPAAASFTANPLSGNAPLTVAFSNTSTGDIAAYSWDFNGDTVPDSAEVSPVFTYANPGTYGVTLTTTGTAGDVSTATATITVNTAAVPAAASFTADPLSGNAPLTVMFTNTSTGDIASYSWDFNGDGTPDSAEVSPIFTYANPGTYGVTLTATGTTGDVSTATATITVNTAAVPAAASFTADPLSGNAPLTVMFTNTSTGDIASYSWDFNGDGTPDSAEVSPIFTFDTPGAYTVSLTAAGTAGDVSTAAATISVNTPAVPPTANFTADPLSGNAPLTVAFTNTSSGDIVTHNWDFNGDGTPDNAEVSPIFTYTAPGIYNVSLTVTGSTGETNSAATTITVNPSAPPPSTGELIAFSTQRDGNNEIYVMNPDSSNPVNLTNNGANDNSPAWSPDGSQIVFVSDREGDNDIFVMNADGSNVTQLTFDSSDDNSPAWSPDGNHIIFVTDRDGNREIYVMNADGSNPTNISNNGADERYPDWSPDGNRILFVTDRDGNREIYVMNADGSNPTNISNNGADERYPDWSPDGNRILFITDRDGNREVYVMNADGSNPTNISNSGADERHPDWSPDGNQVVFITDRDGNQEVYVMNTDGSNSTNISNNGAEDDNPVWRAKP